MCPEKFKTSFCAHSFYASQVQDGVIDFQQTHYHQVKNPGPVFTPREGAGTLKFYEELMEKAVGSTSRSDFAIHVVHARSKGLRRHTPSVPRHRAIDALLQGLCFHHDPLANRVQCSTTTPAIERGLVAESAAGKLSITRATQALTLLAELGLTTYQTEYDPFIGCHIPIDIAFTPAPFAALDVFEDVVVATRHSRAEWEDRQRKKRGLDTPGMDELITKAWHSVRECSRGYQTEFKLRGIKRARVRRDANRGRQDIVALVRRQPTHEISKGRSTASREVVKREVERRMRERMILPRNRNYSRLAAISP